MTKTTANHSRRINALLKKTTFNGCTPGEAASALSLASTIVTKHGLNSADFTWPEPPTGWRWEGVRGHGGTVVEIPAKADPKPKRARTTKPTEPKAPRMTNWEKLHPLLQRGATIEEICEALGGILNHTGRAAVSVEARKKRGLDVRIDKETRRYRIVA